MHHRERKKQSTGGFAERWGVLGMSREPGGAWGEAEGCKVKSGTALMAKQVSADGGW